MPDRKIKYKPIDPKWLSWTTQLADVTNVPYDDLSDDLEDDVIEDDVFDEYDDLDPLAKGKQKDPRQKRPDTKGERRRDAKQRLKELGLQLKTLLDGLPGAFSEQAGTLDKEFQRLKGLAETELDDWIGKEIEPFEGEIEALELKVESLGDTRRRHTSRVLRLQQRVAELNGRAIEVRFQASHVLNDGISLLKDQYQVLARRAEQEVGELGFTGLTDFEAELDRFERQADALESLFEECPEADDFLNWASTQKEKTVLRLVDTMNEALKKQPPDLPSYFDSLVELERLREKSERELARRRRIDELTYKLATVQREVQTETEAGLHKRSELEVDRKELVRSAGALKQDILGLGRGVRTLQDQDFLGQIEKLERRFKSLEKDNDLHQGLVEERSEEKASREYLKEVNERGARPTTIARARTIGEPTGWVMAAAVAEVSAKIKKWGMYDDVMRVWRGAGENRSGPKTNVLHHHCNDNYKHNLLYDGMVILGIVNGHMEKDALKSIQKQEENVAARKGGEAKEVCLLADRVLVIV